jgi:hypothetical protein
MPRGALTNTATRGRPSATSGAHAVLGGKAVVCCVHNREKRQVQTEAQVAALGLAVGRLYDPKQDKLHLCSCCANLFVDPSDEPRFCSVCLRVPTHALGGPLPDPKGVVA